LGERKKHDSCPDCGVRLGERHKEGYDVERCPHCGRQALGCVGFDTNDPRREPWTGKWPGEADCERLGFFIGQRPLAARYQSLVCGMPLGRQSATVGARPTRQAGNALTGSLVAFAGRQDDEPIRHRQCIGIRTGKRVGVVRAIDERAPLAQAVESYRIPPHVQKRSCCAPCREQPVERSPCRGPERSATGSVTSRVRCKARGLWAST
jgi:hypothetical protein